MDQTERKQAEAAICASEARYRMLLESMDQGFCIVQMLGSTDDPIDFRILKVNDMADKHTGLAASVGKTISALVPNDESQWIKRFASVAITGQPVHFEDFSHSLNRWLEVFATSCGGSSQQNNSAAVQRHHSAKAIRKKTCSNSPQAWPKQTGAKPSFWPRWRLSCETR